MSEWRVEKPEDELVGGDHVESMFVSFPPDPYVQIWRAKEGGFFETLCLAKRSVAQSIADAMNSRTAPEAEGTAGRLIHIGHLLRNEYGFISAHVEKLSDLPLGKSDIYTYKPGPQEK